MMKSVPNFQFAKKKSFLFESDQPIDSPGGRPTFETQVFDESHNEANSDFLCSHLLTSR